jgi:hypothetical protein
MPPPVPDIPDAAYAAQARALIDQHTDWDAMHTFVTLHWRDGGLHIGTYVAIDPGVEPRAYPALMISYAHEWAEAHPGDPAAGYGLQTESYGIDQPPGASAELRASIDAARATRSYRDLPGHYESADAIVTDIHGNLWSAAKIRGRDTVEERHWPQGWSPDGENHIEGQMPDALRTLGLATGWLEWGIPLPADLAAAISWRPR